MIRVRTADVVAAYGFLGRRHGWRRALDQAGVAEALLETEALAAGRIEDLSAALLLAFWRRPMDLGDGGDLLPCVLARNVAGHLGWVLDLDLADRAVRALRWRVLARDPASRPGFEEVRAFVAARSRRQQ